MGMRMLLAALWRIGTLRRWLGPLRQSLVCTFAKRAFHSGGQRYGGVAILVAQPVGCRQSLLPTIVFALVQQIHLFLNLLKGGCLHTQQAHPGAAFPVLEEKRADLIEDLRVELCGPFDGVGAGV